jgi:hypothetical protein
MIVQLCLKGMSFPDEQDAKRILWSGSGIVSQWWRTVKTISPPEVRLKLTPANLDMHVNHFDEPDPLTNEPFSKHTPFISLTAGTVERDDLARTNIEHSALQTALLFGSDYGRLDVAYVFRCWLIVAPRSAVEIEGVSEEIRDLNTYRRYSAYQTEGEIAAKVIVPDNQIEHCQQWLWDGSPRTLRPGWLQPNPRFTLPSVLSNVRELLEGE